MSDRQRLSAYVDVWWQAVTDLLALLEQVPAERWDTPTDLPGWDVRACAAHVAHLERVLAGHPEETADVGEPTHVTGPMGLYTEIGVVKRRTHTPEAIVAEIREASATRYAALLADPPTDAAARPPVAFAGMPWSWETLLRNRPLDVWMHEQDVRRAVGLPGGMDSPAAAHTAQYLAEGLGYVLVKRVGAPAGTTVVLEVSGQAPLAFAVTDAGRGERLPAVPAGDSGPTVTLRTDRESFLLLAGGRRGPDTVTVEVVGDQDLGARILAHLATTP